MNNRLKFRMTIFIVFFLLLVAVIFYILTGSSGTANENPFRDVGTVSEFRTLEPVPQQPENNAGQTQDYAGQQGGSSAALPVQQTAAPVMTPAPTPLPTPVPTPEPTPVPRPVGMPLGSGRLESATGTLLNIHADWQAAVADENTADVTVTVYVDHYQLEFNAMQPLYISLGEQSAQPEGVDIHDGEPGLKSTAVGTHTFRVPLARGEQKSLPLSARWTFNGSYGDGNKHTVDIGTIECSGTVSISG